MSYGVAKLPIADEEACGILCSIGLGGALRNTKPVLGRRLSRCFGASDGESNGNNHQIGFIAFDGSR
jgi:hypothetical protein